MDSGAYALQLFFDKYLKGGLYPFALAEADPLAVLQNILDTVLQRDIPHAAEVTYQDSVLIRKALTYIGRSAVDGVNPTTVAKNLSITRYKALEYISFESGIHPYPGRAGGNKRASGAEDFNAGSIYERLFNTHPLTSSISDIRKIQIKDISAGKLHAIPVSCFSCRKSGNNIRKSR